MGCILLVTINGGICKIPVVTAKFLGTKALASIASLGAGLLNIMEQTLKGANTLGLHPKD